MALESISTFYASLPSWLILTAVIWEIIWKGFALWKSSKLNSPIWFVVILVTNTLGILPILYLFIFSGIKLGRKNADKIQKTSRSKTSKKSRR